ncbi:PPC domain-containing DNA-binding protein [Moorena producens]|uniref:PPC domain-containing DNA-binding protein n=1 Tax=Moorena producens TaxID=1155739 RepID=UPI003C726F2F
MPILCSLFPIPYSLLINVVKQNTIQSGFILTAVGSLKQANLRFANQNTNQLLIEKFEIVSLVGTLSIHSVHWVYLTFVNFA